MMRRIGIILLLGIIVMSLGYYMPAKGFTKIARPTNGDVGMPDFKEIVYLTEGFEGLQPTYFKVNYDQTTDQFDLEVLLNSIIADRMVSTYGWNTPSPHFIAKTEGITNYESQNDITYDSIRLDVMIVHNFIPYMTIKSTSWYNTLVSIDKFIKEDASFHISNSVSGSIGGFFSLDETSVVYSESSITSGKTFISRNGEPLYLYLPVWTVVIDGGIRWRNVITGETTLYIDYHYEMILSMDYSNIKASTFKVGVFPEDEFDSFLYAPEGTPVFFKFDNNTGYHITFTESTFSYYSETFSFGISTMLFNSIEVKYDIEMTRETKSASFLSVMVAFEPMIDVPQVYNKLGLEIVSPYNAQVVYDDNRPGVAQLFPTTTASPGDTVMIKGTFKDVGNTSFPEVVEGITSVELYFNGYHASSDTSYHKFLTYSTPMLSISITEYMVMPSLPSTQETIRFYVVITDAVGNTRVATFLIKNGDYSGGDIIIIM